MDKIDFTVPLNEDENKKLRKEFTKRFALKIREVRKNKGLTQTQVAEMAGLHEAYYGHIELSRFRPSLFVAWKIAKALKMPLDKLIDF